MSSRRAGRMNVDLHRRLGLRDGLIPVEDLLGGELREPVLEEDGEQRMVERQPYVEPLHAVFEPAIAHAVEQFRPGEVSVRARGGAEVEDLPRAGPHRQRLDLHEADHALLHVLGDEHLLGGFADRDQG